MAIDFVYNENACREVVNLYRRKIKELLDEINKLEQDKKSTNEIAVIAAYDDYINGLKKQISSLETKIEDVQSKPALAA
jgi:flagellar biosynthesis chaperone FliJ